MALGLAVALGIVSGVNVRDEAGVSAGLLIPLMAIAVGLAAKAVPWFGAAHGPRWAQYMIRAGCAAPLLAIGAAPIMASHDSEQGVGVWIGLLAVAVLGNWTRAFERAQDGEVSVGCAMRTAFGALVATAMAIGMMDGEPPPYMFIAAGVAGSVSLIVQASSWWAGSRGGRAAYAMGGVPPTVGASESAVVDGRGSVSVGATEGVAPAAASGLPPFAYPFRDQRARRMFDTMQAAMQSARQRRHAQGDHGGDIDPRVRWGVTRAFGSVVSFLLMGGAIITFLLTFILDDLHYDDRTGLILGCIACAAMFTVAVRKTTPLRREGFWRDTGRPFFLAVTMFGIGGTITGIARFWTGMRGEEHALLIVGLVFSSLWFLVLLFARGRRGIDRPFLKGSPDDPSEDGAPPVDNDPAGQDHDNDPAPAQPA